MSESIPPGTFGWHDLTVPDAAGLRDFYARVLGWSWQAVSMGTYDDYVMLTPSGEVAGGICHARGVNADLPPIWVSYLVVSDLERALAAVNEGGGLIKIPPRAAGEGQMALIEDPAGALLGLWQAGATSAQSDDPQSKR